MEGSAFDRLARAVGVGGSRRGLLRLVVGLPLAGLLTRLDDEEGAARRKRHGRRRGHRPGKDKENRKGQRQDDGAALGESCSSNSDCRNGKSCCSGTCVNVQNDDSNCGSCGNVCFGPSPTCVDGACTCTTVLCTGSGCCPSRNDVCAQNDECCSPKTCQDIPPGDCGPQDDGCGGTITCVCCPDTPCDCPPGRTLCDDFTGPKVYCTDSSCLCVEDVNGSSICYSGGTCYNDTQICQTDEDCEEDYPGAGLLCVKAGSCGLNCLETACVIPCSPDSPDEPPPIEVRTSPK
jgi:hypothetical protein